MSFGAPNKHGITHGRGSSGAPPSNEIIFEAFWREKGRNILGLRHSFLFSFSYFLVPIVVLGENWRKIQSLRRSYELL